MRLAALVLAFMPVGATAQTITGAAFDAPTTRYAHGILGDAVEYGALVFTVERDGVESRYRINLPEDHVFEDITPRLWDLTGDGQPEIVVIETDVTLGAALAVYGPEGKLAETPHIGQPNRWLAPIGAADLDGDGFVEIAYIDRPHLAKTLRLWRWRDGSLEPVADLPGLTNHRIGEVAISGGLRDCGKGPELVTANADWSRVMATTYQNGALVARDIGRFDSASMARALACAAIAD